MIVINANPTQVALLKKIVLAYLDDEIEIDALYEYAYNHILSFPNQYDYTIFCVSIIDNTSIRLEALCRNKELRIVFFVSDADLSTYIYTEENGIYRNYEMYKTQDNIQQGIHTYLEWFYSG